MKLNGLTRDISQGKSVTPSALLPFLCSDKKEERCRVNAGLAKAFCQCENYSQAKSFIQRAWILSGFSSELLPLYLKIHSALDDIDSIQKAYKQIGMKMASASKVLEALNYFHSSMYAYATYKQIDRYEYDFDILEKIKMLATPHRFETVYDPGLVQGRKIRLAYLVFGILQSNSVVVKMDKLFAKYHDKSKFEVVFFVPERKQDIMKSKEALHNIKIIESFNCKVVLPEAKDEEENLFEVAKHIYSFQPDVLITNALLADLKHYFIVSLNPCPVVIGFSQGPPPQFVSPELDWSIAWTKHPLMDCPCGCSRVSLEVELPERGSISFLKKRDLNLPENSLIIMGAGRYTKFQNTGYWEAILDILCQFPNAYYVVVGVDREKLPFLDEFKKHDSLKRVKFFGWQKNFYNILGLADILLDTYPSGGGVVLIDAMALGIPVVSFRNDYLKIFDQVGWSPAEEFVQIPELIADRGNFDQFKQILNRLIEDKVFHNKASELCREIAKRNFGSPDRMVRKCEDIYIKVIKNNSHKAKNISSGIPNADNYFVSKNSGIISSLFMLTKFFKNK